MIARSGYLKNVPCRHLECKIHENSKGPKVTDARPAQAYHDNMELKLSPPSFKRERLSFVPYSVDCVVRPLNCPLRSQMVGLHLRFPASIVPELSSVAENPVSVVHAPRDDLSSVYQSSLQSCISPHVADDSSDSRSRYLRSFGKVTKDAGRLTQGLVGAVRDIFNRVRWKFATSIGYMGFD